MPSSGVIVLGTGRSGTSAITRAFVAAGYFVGREDEVLGPSSSNPHGHYEPMSVLGLNEELLADFGCDWWAQPPAEAEQLRRREEIEPRIAAVLRATMEAAGEKPIAIKEPRINSLLPLWGPLVEGLLHPVLAVRNPLEVAMSLASRDATPIAHGLAAWETQWTLVLGWLEGRPVTVAPYVELITQPQRSVEVVASASAHLAPGYRERVDAQAAAAALDPNLRNEVASAAAEEYLTGRQADLWGFLQGLPLGAGELRVPPSLRTPSAAALEGVNQEGERLGIAAKTAALEVQFGEVNARAEELERLLTATDERLAEAEEQAAAAAARHQAEVAALTSSLSWRVTAPLRRLRRQRDSA